MTKKWPLIELSSARADGMVRVPLFVLGQYVWQGMKVTIDAKVVGEVQKNFAARSIDIVLSYEHTVCDPALAMGQPIPAAGWLKEIEAAPVKDADGRFVLWGWATLTPEGRTLVETEQYKYTSPAFSLDYDSHQTGKNQGATLLSLALTNTPFLDTPAIQFSAVAWSAAQSKEEGKSMADKKQSFKKARPSPITEGPQKGNLLIQHSDFPAGSDDEQQNYYVDSSEARSALGKTANMSAADIEAIDKVVMLSGVAGATTLSADVITAIASKVSASANVRPVVEMSAVPKDKDGNADFIALSVPHGAVVSGDVYRAMQADIAFSAALKEGRVLPAEREHFQRIAMSDVSLFRSMLAVRQPVVNLSASGTGAPGAAAKTSTITLSAAEKRVAKQLGVTEESALKAKQERVKAIAGDDDDDEDDNN